MQHINRFILLLFMALTFGCQHLSQNKNTANLVLMPPEQNRLINSPLVLKEKDCFNWSEQQFSRKDEKFKNRVIAMQSTLSCRFFTYLVEGHPVNGYIIKPKNHSDSMPVLIFNRGGHGTFGKVTVGSMTYSLSHIANKGFIIIGSQYRGTNSKNSVIDDELGGADVNDVTTLNTLIPHIAGANPSRVGMFGHSRGAIQTLLALKEIPNIKAVSVTAGVYDLFQSLKERPEMEKVFKKRIPNYLQNKEVALTKRSPNFWLDELPNSVPVLISHGSDDWRANVNHSISLAKGLKKHNIPHKLVLYPDDNHGIRQNKKTHNDEISNWFIKYL